jgi:hypothetical protein
MCSLILIILFTISYYNGKIVSFQNNCYKYHLKKEKQREFEKNTIGKDLEKMTQLFNPINRDCSLHGTSCVTTSDCQKNCATDGNIYACNEKALTCLPINTDNVAQTTKCNPFKGIFSVLVNYQEFNQANWECVSLYPQLINSDETLAPGVCTNGNLINMNINTHLPQPQDCQCSISDTLITFNNSTIPHCVSNVNLFSQDDISTYK